MNESGVEFIFDTAARQAALHSPQDAADFARRLQQLPGPGVAQAPPSASSASAASSSGAAPSPVSWVFRPDQVAPPCSTSGTPKLNHYILPDSLRSYSGQYARSRSLTPQPAQGGPSAGLQQHGRQQPAAWAPSPDAGACTASIASEQPSAAQPVSSQAPLGSAGTLGAQYAEPSLGGQQQSSLHQSRESGLQQGSLHQSRQSGLQQGSQGALTQGGPTLKPLTSPGPAWAQHAQQPQGSHQQGFVHQSEGSEWQQNSEHQSTTGSPQQHPRVAQEQHKAGPQGQAGWSYSVEPPSSVWQRGRSQGSQQAPAGTISAEHMSGAQWGAAHASGQQAASALPRATSAIHIPIASQAVPWPAGSLALGDIPASPYTPAANRGSVAGQVCQGQPAASFGGGPGGHSSLAAAAATPPEAVLPSLPVRPASNRGDLLAPLLPSMEDGRLHATVSGLRVALQQAQQTLDHTQQQVVDLQRSRDAAQSEAAERGQMLSRQQQDMALLQEQLHHGNLDAVRGGTIAQLQEQAKAQAAAAASAAIAQQQAVAEQARLHQQMQAQQQAAAAERERLSMETAQSRLLCKARARQVADLEEKLNEQVEAATAAKAELQQGKLHTARAQADAMLQADASARHAHEAQQQAAQMRLQLQEAQRAAAQAEAAREMAEATLHDTRLHMDWQEARIAELDSQDGMQTARRYDQELQAVQAQAQVQMQELQGQLRMERQRREAAEAQAQQLRKSTGAAAGRSPAGSHAQAGSPHTVAGGAGSRLLGATDAENVSPNRGRQFAPRQSASSSPLKAQLHQARESAQQERQQWEATLQAERTTVARLQQQLDQMKDSDQLVAQAAAGSQHQVQQLRQQLEAEKSRAMMLEAQLEAAQHSRRTGALQRRRCRQSQPDWQTALGSSGDDCSGAESSSGGSISGSPGTSPIHQISCQLRPVGSASSRQANHTVAGGEATSAAGRHARSWETPAATRPQSPEAQRSAVRQQFAPAVAVASVAVQTEGTDSAALLAGMGQAPGRDSLLAAARQEILRLKEVNKRLAQQRAPVQPDNLAEAAAQQAAATLKQKEEALQRSTAMWISRTGRLEDEVRSAHAEARQLQEAHARCTADQEVAVRQLQACKAQSLQLQADLDTCRNQAAELQSQMKEGERQASAARVEAASLQQQLEQRQKELQRQLTAAQQQAEGADVRAADLQQQLAHHQEQAEQHWKQLQLEADSETAMALLEATSAAAEAAARVDAVRQEAETSKQAALAELRQELVSAGGLSPAEKGASLSSASVQAGPEMASAACQTVLEAEPEQPAVRSAANPEEAGPSAAEDPESSQALTVEQEGLAQTKALQQAAPDQRLGACTDAAVQAGHLPCSRDDVQAVLKSSGTQTDSPEQQQQEHPGSMEAPLLPDLGLRIRTSLGSHRSSTAQRLEAAHRATAGGVALQPHQRDSGSQTDEAASLCMPGATITLHCSTQGSAEDTPGASSMGRSADAAGLQQRQQRGSGRSSQAALSAEQPTAKQGLDPAVVQHWVTAVQTPSQDALALSRMADAAAAAARAAADAAGSVAGSRDGAASPRTVLDGLARRIGRKAQVKSGEAGGNRHGQDLAEDDMCRVEQESSMHGTPDASFASARTVRSPGRSQGYSQSAWGRGARARLLAPVQSASPFIDHQARQWKGSASDSMASPLAAAQPSQYPGPFSQTGRPAVSTLLPPASIHSQPAGASEHSENGGFSPAASHHTRRSQGKVPPRQSSNDERPASQWPPSDRSSPAGGLGQPERSLWRSVVEHQATGLVHYRDKPQGAWGGASLLEERSEHPPLPKLEVPESSSWLALHQDSQGDLAGRSPRAKSPYRTLRIATESQGARAEPASGMLQLLGHRFGQDYMAGLSTPSTQHQDASQFDSDHDRPLQGAWSPKAADFEWPHLQRNKRSSIDSASKQSWSLRPGNMDDSSSALLRASEYHRERSRLQELMASQHAMVALSPDSRSMAADSSLLGAMRR